MLLICVDVLATLTLLLVGTIELLACTSLEVDGSEKYTPRIMAAEMKTTTPKEIRQ
jgi:hypothetical protein